MLDEPRGLHEGELPCSGLSGHMQRTRARYVCCAIVCRASDIVDFTTHRDRDTAPRTHIIGYHLDWWPCYCDAVWG